MFSNLDFFFPLRHETVKTTSQLLRIYITTFAQGNKIFCYTNEETQQSAEFVEHSTMILYILYTQDL